MSIEFQKMHGLGNDFVVIQENPDFNVSLNQDSIKSLANRKTGIGFEQLLIVRQLGDGLVEMKIFNEDGSEADFCGNGLRCVAGLYLDRNKSDSIVVRTSGRGDSKCWRDERRPDWVVSNVGKADIVDRDFKIELDGKILSGVHVNVGNSHVVFFMPYSEVDLAKLGPLVKSKFSIGVNVSLVQVRTRDEIWAQVWESGCGITLACGSAACAGFYAALEKNLINSHAKVRFSIGHLELELDHERNIIMAGPYSHVFSGRFNIQTK